MSDYLCEELIIEILTRLPSKSLLRFRSLSKSLCVSISSPGFIRLYTSRSPQQLLIRHKTSYKLKDVEDFYTVHSEDKLPLFNSRGYFGSTAVKFPYSKYSEIVGSCNGILCVTECYENRISLWNPSIRHKLIIPHCPQRDYTCIGVGFCFDPISDDYKIVTICRQRENSFIYSLKTGAWCVISSPTPLFSSVISKACLVNGAFHWVVERDRFENYRHEHDRYIVTYDLSSHVFGIIPLPEPSWEKTGLTTIQGSLAMISTDHNANWIWVWRDASWSVLLKLEKNQVKGGLKGVLQLTSNGDLLLNTHRHEAKVYNPKIGVRSGLVEFKASSYIFDIVPCAESLQLFDMGTMLAR